MSPQRTFYQAHWSRFYPETGARIAFRPGEYN